MIYGYIRVSTDKQNIENQKFEIQKFTSQHNLVVNRWITETISSTSDLNKRKLGKILKQLKTGDILITSELSRLGRNLMQIMSILHHCMENGCQVWTIKDNYKLGMDIQSKVLAFAFGLSAEIERNLISSRTKEALQRLRAEGKIIGRPLGSKNKTTKLRGKEIIIKNMIEKQIPKIQIAKNLHINISTLYRYLKC